MFKIKQPISSSHHLDNQQINLVNFFQLIYFPSARDMGHWAIFLPYALPHVCNPSLLY